MKTLALVLDVLAGDRPEATADEVVCRTVHLFDENGQHINTGGSVVYTKPMRMELAARLGPTQHVVVVDSGKAFPHNTPEIFGTAEAVLEILGRMSVKTPNRTPDHGVAIAGSAREMLQQHLRSFCPAAVSTPAAP